MSNVRQGRTLKGEKNYTVVVGNTTYVRTRWSDILDVLTARSNDIPSVNAGYGTGVYSGD